MVRTPKACLELGRKASEKYDFTDLRRHGAPKPKKLVIVPRTDYVEISCFGQLARCRSLKDKVQ